MTITEEAATTPCVLSLTCAADADLPATPHPIACRVNDSANPHKQPFSKITTPLLEQHYEPPTPIKVNQLSELLQHHPDSDKVQYVIQGLWHGFDLEYSGPFEPRTPDNLSTETQDPQLIKDKLQKEVKLGHMVGPFKEPPFPDLICSPVSLVPKKESSELRMIMHLSYPYGGSINDFIDPEKAATKYQSFQDAVRLVVQQGQFCWLAKGDVKSAFRVALIIFKHLRCLGIYFNDEYYVDCALPFSSSISCTIFEEIARLYHWIFEQRSSAHFIHYLDDFLWVHRNFIVCVNTSRVVKETSVGIGLPLAPEKFVEPTQSLTFLGLVLDSVCMAVAIPKYKQDKIEQRLLEMITAKKTTVKKVQALAGSLNFITRAVPHGRPFMQKMYDLVARLQPNWHLSITSEVERDCHMWLHFIRDYGGWTQILTPQMPMVLLYTDVATTEDLGWGAW